MMTEKEQQGSVASRESPVASESAIKQEKTAEIGGPKGLEPTRYGDWENNGRCWDF